MDEGKVSASRLHLTLDGEDVDPAAMGLLSADVLLTRRCVGAFSVVFADSPDSDRLSRVRSVSLAVPLLDGVDRARDFRRLLITGDVTATRHERDTVGGSAVVLRGFDAGGRLAEGRRTRSWIGLDAFGVADALAREHGLELDRGEATASSPSSPSSASSPSNPAVPTLQNDESDWSFLRRLAARAHVELQVDGRRLLFGGVGSGAGGTRPMEWGVEPSLKSVQSDGRIAELVLRGATPLRPSQAVHLRGCGPHVDGVHRVEEVRFLLDGVGWTSLVVAARR